MSAAGFAPDRRAVRKLAYQFAEKLGIKHNFSKEKEEAGFAWLHSFLDRNPELSVRQAEGLSLSRARGMNRDDVRKFFDLLEKVMTENDLLNKPSHIYNMDETGVQLINKPGKVITKKGAKDVHVLTSKERGENVTVIACCSADGKYIPPTLIFKGVNRKPEFSDGLPGGSKVYMNRKSSFINSELFLRWLREQFIPHKPSGKCLLILDGHTSHSSDIEMLQLADDNDIIILCLPSHCTQALQPLDRSFFRPFKIYFNQEAQLWMKNHSSRNLTRYQAGELIGKAWLRTASVGIAVNGFRATGIYPLDPNAVPDHFFAVLESNPEVVPNDPSTTSPRATTSESVSTQERVTSDSPEGTPSCVPKFTPTKLLHESSPVPKVRIPLNNRRKQAASVLTTTENIQDKKDNLNKGKGKRLLNKETQIKSSIKTSLPLTNGKDGTGSNKASNSTPTDKAQDFHIGQVKDGNIEPEWSGSDEEPLIKKGNYNVRKEKEYFCVECFEPYEKTTKKDDWLQCIKCLEWLHESCTMYAEQCNICSRAELRKKNWKAPP